MKQPFHLPKVQWSQFAAVVVCWIILVSLLIAPNVLISHLIVTLLLGLLLPGYSVIRLFPQKDLLETPFERVGWSVLISFLIVSSALLTLLILSGGQIVVTQKFIQNTLILISALLPLSAFILPLNFKKRISWKDTYPSLLPFIFVGLFFAVPFLLNPIAQNNDQFLAHALLYYHGTPASLNDLRPIFSMMSAAYARLGNTSLYSTFLYLPLILFMASMACYWGTIQREIKTRMLQVVALTGLVSSPVIAIEINITRPQAIILCFVLPLLLIGMQALKKNSPSLASIGILLSILLVPFHELASVFVLFFLVTLLITLKKSVISGQITLKKILLIVVVLFPYLIILHLDTIFAQTFGIFRYIANYALSNFHWRWWFINSYTTVDNIQLGWPGIQALYYYLYNGLLFYVFIVFCFLIIHPKWRTIFVSPWLFPATFLAFFFFFAEIAPRLGFYFLLNRTWPYIALAASVLCIPLYKKIEKLPIKIQKIMFCVGLFVSLIGISGIIKVAHDNVYEVFPEEKGAITFISHLPSRSLIISTQDNSELATIYGGQLFLLTDQANFSTAETLNSYIHTTFLSWTSSSFKTTSTTTYTTTLNGRVVSTRTDPTTIISNTIVQIPENGFNQAYFIFSKRKAEGVYANRRDVYSNGQYSSDIPSLIKSYPLVYQDNNSSIYLLPNP